MPFNFKKATPCSHVRELKNIKYAMSSPGVDKAHFPSSPPLQSAQQAADQIYAEDDNLESASDYLSDALSDLKPSSQQPSPGNSTASDGSEASRSASEDEHQDLLDEDSEGSTSLLSRPNKFRGPPSTWRNWTAPERDLATSLDQLQATDLSVHLYNSFKLRQRNRDRTKRRRARSAEKPGKANDGSDWTPPKVWTAWPLPPGIVPREQYEKHWEEDAVQSEMYHAMPERPGRHLQEMLVAQVLRKAKERFYDRVNGIVQHPAIPSLQRSQDSQGRRRGSNGRSPAEAAEIVPHQKIAVMADDSRAGEILRPTVQHMMSKLDNLLMGLHHARSAYLSVEDSGSDSQGHTSESSTSRIRLQKGKRVAPTSDEDTEAGHDPPSHPVSDFGENVGGRKKSLSQDVIKHARASSRRSPSQKFRERKARLGLRDWSDVLGVASMIGWHQEVVGSATARCAAIFGEGIKFRTLEEGRKAQEEHLYLPDASPVGPGIKIQGNTWRARESFSQRFESGMVGGVHVDGFLEPIEGKKSWKYTNNKHPKRRKTSGKSRE